MSALLSEVFQTVLPTCEVVAPEQAQVREHVALERASFRERTSHWVQDQRAALAVCHECACRWWDGLSAGERGMRLQRLGAEFEALSVCGSNKPTSGISRNAGRGVPHPAQVGTHSDAYLSPPRI